MKKIILLTFISFNLLSSAQNLFVQPVMTFIHTPTEVITDLSISSGTSIANIQTQINAKRAAFPTNIIRITLSGTFTVTTDPILLTDNMLLILKNATITAAAGATAGSLISVTGGHYITIAGYGTSLLDGNNLYITGINVTTSGKTHIDKIPIQNCKSGGIMYSGAGAAVYADAGSVTRCNISNCTAFGISFSDSYNFVCTDNVIQNCNTGISVNANYTATCNNSVTGCSTGIYVAGQYDVAAYNSLTSCTTAVSIFNGIEALVSHNIIKSNSTAFNLTCGTARVYYNTLQGNTSALAGTGATTNQIFCNKGLTATDVAGKTCSYFNPPTIGNQHTDIIKSGKTRTDITVTSGNLSSIRTALDNAHSSNPTSVIVCHLNGNFNSSSATDTLLIKDNECILLNGTIANNSAKTNTILYFKDSNIISSFSGGTIDGEGINGTNSLIYITGSPNIVLDSITVRKSAGQGIYKQNSSSPTYIRACKVDSCGSRNIWSLVSSRMYAFSNISTNSKYDGIDLDAYSKSSVVMKNTLNNNSRYGLFIEEGANSMIAIGNTTNYNSGPGIAFYNLNVANLHSSMCLIANNTCNYNQRGVHLNAFNVDRSTNDNTIFNNTCNNNTDVGIGGLYNATTSQNNYLAFNSIQNNRSGQFSANRDYTVNSDWNLLYPTDITTLVGTEFIHFKMNIHGNISKNILKVDIEGSDSPIILTLRDFTGKIIRSFSAQNGVNYINTQNISSGVYLLQVSNSKSTLTNKFLKF